MSIQQEDLLGERPPSHWVVTRLGRLGRWGKGYGGSKKDNQESGIPVVRYGDLYTTFQTTIEHPVAYVSSEDADRYAPLHPGTLVFTASGEDPEEIGKAAVSMLPDPAVVGGDAITLEPDGDVDPLFLAYGIQAHPLRTHRALRSTGFTVVHISAAKLKTIPLALPPLGEQRAIADFLNRETAKIDALIEKQNELISLLRERRGAAVQHRLDVFSAEHSTIALGYVIGSIDQGASPSCATWPVANPATDWCVLKVGCVNYGVFRPDENKALLDLEYADPKHAVQAGDVVVSRGNTRELVGSAAHVPTHLPRALLSDLLYRVRTRSDLYDPQFLATVLGSRHARDQIELEARGSSHTMPKISQAVLRKLQVPHIPLAEQRALQTSIAAETAKIDALIAKAEEHIALAQERRAALITAAVTGQLDIPGETN
ncbi:restriction endonuclease subunit S [Propioniferax innocua]|uniref:Type I restriction enzyme S subunit n=1 Tax=Propioniferax innocua TaxID=1753 RepID=A0A542ZT53_9ACTN|nr:restriction endonuclease subunit S [Propioniferax innocua]TQL63466.1 type I restriction enzyme S subunit [Propioniferax innocua]